MGSSISSSLQSGRAVLMATWLFAGIGCVFLDEQIQPWFMQVGHIPSVRRIAENWQQLGATPGITLFLLAGLWLVARDKGRTLLHFVVSVSLAGAAVQTLKYLIGRVRPNEAGNSTIFVGPFGLLNPASFHRIDSMPSGHTTAAFAMAMALAYRWPRQGWLWLGLALGIGASRILVDAHFLSDVIVGALLGAVIGSLVNRSVQSYLYAQPQAIENQISSRSKPIRVAK